MISLRPAKEFRFPVTAECISPDVFEGKSLSEIEALPVWEGNKQRKFGELFKVEEAEKGDQAEDTVIVIHGDVTKVRRIGARMTRGEITVNGNVGMHLGEGMKGGSITVQGNVEGWAGSMMKGGIIKVHGNAGDYMGAPYRGSNEGMHGGKIIVYGNVGNEAGAHMKKGTIKVYGNAGQFLGFRMRDGTIYVQKDSGDRAGACMVGGKIVIGGFIESVLPTFTIDSVKQKVKIEENEAAERPFYLFLGDLSESSGGKLYVSKEKNPHLSHYERFL
jgi:formylmethanofuran dehydrogenase subunit C